MDVLWTPIIATLTGAIGWYANHWLISRREQDRRRYQAELNFVERQIEELYGPMAAALYEGARAFNDLLETLGRNYVFSDDSTISDGDLKTWLFWTENEFLPRNANIKNLLTTKAHLIARSEFPESYVKFFDHCNSWDIKHRRWKSENIEYSWHSNIGWPDEFEQEVINEFQALKRRHSELIGHLISRK